MGQTINLLIDQNIADNCLLEGARRYTNQRISVTIAMLLGDYRLLLAFAVRGLSYVISVLD
jgi:hypothetical protein